MSVRERMRRSGLAARRARPKRAGSGPRAGASRGFARSAAVTPTSGRPSSGVKPLISKPRNRIQEAVVPSLPNFWAKYRMADRSPTAEMLFFRGEHNGPRKTLDHQHHAARGIDIRQRRHFARQQLITKHQPQLPSHDDASRRGGDLAADRQRSEQNFTLPQSRAHFLRQAKPKPQVAQILVGKSTFLRIFAMSDDRSSLWCAGATARHPPR